MEKMQIGDKLVDVEIKNGIPVIQAKSRQIKYPDGRIDVVVEIPCLTIKSEQKKG